MKTPQMVVLAILLQLLFIYPNLSPILIADQTSKRFDERLKKGMEIENPIGELKLKNTTAAEGFKYFSGNTAPINSHPAIYAGSERLIVVGYKYYKEFPVDQLSEAFKAYRELLILDGYLKK